MWIGVKGMIRRMSEGEALYVDGTAIRLRSLEAGDTVRRMKICSYKSEDRAKEVLTGFWMALQRGERCYEFPQE